MKDRVFFPLTIGVALFMVGGAMMVDADKPPCGPFGAAAGDGTYREIVMAGRDLCRMEAAFGHELVQSAPERQTNTLTIFADPGSLRGEVEASAHFKLGPDIENVLAGRFVTITISARPSAQRGAEAFEFNYSTGKAGNTGWYRFDMRPGWQDYTHTVELPEKLLETVVAEDYLAIRPVLEEKRRGVEVRKITFVRGDLTNN